MAEVSRGSTPSGLWGLVRPYASLDPRALGLFRIAFGALLLGDIARRWSDIALFYSNDGVLSNHFNAFHPAQRPMFSLFTAFSSPSEAKLAFFLTGVVFALHMVGAFTAVTRVLVPVLCASLAARNVFVTNAGTSVVTLLAIWTAFLPVGERFSVDAVRRSLQRDHEPTVSAMGDVQRSKSAVVSIAVFGLLFELVAIYALNALQKSGPTWRSGEAVHDVLWQDRLVTGLGAWLRDHEAPWLSPLLSHGTRLVEAAVALLLVFPWRRSVARTTAVVLLAVFHLATALTLSLGPFPYAMVVYGLLFLPSETLDRLGVLLSRWSSPQNLDVAVSKPGDLMALRVLHRLDVFGRLRLTEGDAPLDGSLLASAAAALPMGRFLSPVGPVFAPAFFRLTDQLAGRQAPRKGSLRGTQLGGQIDGTLAAARESFAAVFLITAVLQTSQENWAVPDSLRFAVPERLAPLAGYAGLRRGWSMFAPDAPRKDGALVIDAKTLDGRRIDPLSGGEPAADPARQGPAKLGQMRCDYALKMSFESNAAYREELRRWLQGWRAGGGGVGDRLVWFEASWVSWDTPRPGQRDVTNVERKVLLASGPKPEAR